MSLIYQPRPDTPCGSFRPARKGIHSEVRDALRETRGAFVLRIVDGDPEWTWHRSKAVALEAARPLTVTEPVPFVLTPAGECITAHQTRLDHNTLSLPQPVRAALRIRA